jgi:hypothetical protein
MARISPTASWWSLRTRGRATATTLSGTSSRLRQRARSVASAGPVALSLPHSSPPQAGQTCFGRRSIQKRRLQPWQRCAP